MALRLRACRCVQLSFGIRRRLVTEVSTLTLQVVASEGMDSYSVVDELSTGVAEPTHPSPAACLPARAVRPQLWSGCAWLCAACYLLAGSCHGPAVCPIVYLRC